MKRVRALLCILLAFSLLLPAAFPMGAARGYAAMVVPPALKVAPLPPRQDSNPTPDPSRPLPLPPAPIMPLSTASVLVQPSVYPTFTYQSLAAGTSGSFPITVQTGDAPVEKADFIFTFDLTSSMAEEIGQAKVSAQSIAKAIQDGLKNPWFGVASFMDYTGLYTYSNSFGTYAQNYGNAAAGDVPWRMNLFPSSSLSAFTDAVAGLTLGDGADIPEDYTRVLYELGQLNKVGWRKGAKKIVVLFGDAPTHDVDFDSRNRGGDPGPDGIANTGDDLDFQAVVQDLATKGIAVIAVDSGNTTEGSAATFQGMSVGYKPGQPDGAVGTSGQYALLTDTANLASQVVTLIKSETQTIDKLSLEISASSTPGAVPWVTATPQALTNVPAGTSQSFNVTVSPPLGTPPGNYSFLLQIVADGVILGTNTLYLFVQPTTAGPSDLGYLPNRDGFLQNTFQASGDWPMFRQFYGSPQVEYNGANRIFAADEYFKNTYSHSYETSYGFAGLSLVNFLGLSQPNSGQPPTYGMAWTVPLGSSSGDSNVFNSNMHNPITYAALTVHGAEYAAFDSFFCYSYGTSPALQYQYIKSAIATRSPSVIRIKYAPVAGQSSTLSLAPYRYVEDASNNMADVYVYDSDYPGTNGYRLHFENVLVAALGTTPTVQLQNKPPLADFPVDVISWNQIKDQGCQMVVSPVDLILRKGVPQWEVPMIASAAATATPEKPQLYVLRGSAALLVQDDSNRLFGWDGTTFRNEIPGAVYDSLGGTDADAISQYILPGGYQYKIWLVGTATGSTTLMTWLGSTFVQLANVSTTPGSRIAVDLARDGSTVGFRPDSAPTAATVSINHLLVGEDRTATAGDLQVQPGQTVQMTYTVAEPATLDTAAAGVTAAAAGVDQISLTSSGGPTTSYDLSLQRSGTTGYNVFGSEDIPLDAQSTQVMSVTDWSNPSQVTIVVDYGSDGTLDGTVAATNTAAAASLTISAAPQGIPVGGQETEVTVAVRDQFGRYAADGLPVTISTTAGTLSANSGSTVGGLVTVKLKSGLQAGTALVSATAGSLAGQTEVMFVPAAAASLTSQALPAGLPADGASSTAVIARIVDGFGNPVPGAVVNFATTLGTIDANATTNNSGEATATLTSTLKVGIAKVTATNASIVRNIAVPFVGGKVRGTVFADLNRNGVRDSGEPGLRDITIVAAGKTSDASGIAVTAPNGSYQIADLPFTDYTISAAPRAGLRFTTPTTYSAGVGAVPVAAPSIGGAYTQYLPRVQNRR